VSVEFLGGRWWITTACPPDAHPTGQPCSACWPDPHNHPAPEETP
jgi:hypothetical protein